MTQPVFDPAVITRFLADVAPLGMPVLVGILPLVSHRNAEFLHNEVPGMRIPDAMRARMKGPAAAPSRAGGRPHRREMLAAVRDQVAGAYVMPPLGRYEMALEVIDGFVGAACAVAARPSRPRLHRGRPRLPRAPSPPAGRESVPSLRELPLRVAYLRAELAERPSTRSPSRSTSCRASPSRPTRWRARCWRWW